MYICNHCGCRAMMDDGRKLCCLNCGHVQRKADSRKQTPAPVPDFPQPADPPPKASAPVPPQFTSAPPQASPHTAPNPEGSSNSHSKPFAILALVLAVISALSALAVPLLGFIRNTTVETQEKTPVVEAVSSVYDTESPWFFIDESGWLGFDEYTYLDADTPSPSLVVPPTISNTSSSALMYDAFFCCTYITDIVLPDTIRTIDTNAFYDCDSLTDITISPGVTTIGADAISECDNLTTVHYLGTQAQWDAVDVDAENELLLRCLSIEG